MDKELEKYFKNNEDYLLFLESIAAQLKDITFDGARQIETGKPVVKSGSAIIRILPFKGIPQEGYYLVLHKMGKITHG